MKKITASRTQRAAETTHVVVGVILDQSNKAYPITSYEKHYSLENAASGRNWYYLVAGVILDQSNKAYPSTS